MRPADFFPARQNSDMALCPSCKFHGAPSAHIHRLDGPPTGHSSWSALIHSPHCLKRNGTPADLHWSRSDRSHSTWHSRASLPLSPPAITQWIGSAARKTTVTVILDEWPTQGSVEDTLKIVDGLAPPVPTVEPPQVTVQGVQGVPSSMPWVIQTVTLSERLRRDSDGATSRVQVAFDLLEYRPGMHSAASPGTGAESPPSARTVPRGSGDSAPTARGRRAAGSPPPSP